MLIQIQKESHALNRGYSRPYADSPFSTWLQDPFSLFRNYVMLNTNHYLTSGICAPMTNKCAEVACGTFRQVLRYNHIITTYPAQHTMTFSWKVSETRSNRLLPFLRRHHPCVVTTCFERHFSFHSFDLDILGSANDYPRQGSHQSLLLH